jgi:hypothetical protein
MMTINRPSAMSLATETGHCERLCLHEVQVVASRKEAEALSDRFRPRLQGKDKLPFVGSNQKGASFENVMVFVEVIPRNCMNEVREAIYHASERVYAVNDAVGYESLNDAIIDAESIGSRILDYVEAENLFFAFGESVEALRDALRNFPLPQSVLNAGHDRCAYAGEEQRKGGNEKNPENRAIVLCKLRKAEGIAEFFIAKKKESGDKADRYEVSWGELQKLKNEIKHRCDAELIEDFCKPEGRAK